MELLRFSVLSLLLMACVGLFASIWAESGWTIRIALVAAVTSSAYLAFA